MMKEKPCQIDWRCANTDKHITSMRVVQVMVTTRVELTMICFEFAHLPWSWQDLGLVATAGAWQSWDA